MRDEFAKLGVENKSVLWKNNYFVNYGRTIIVFLKHVCKNVNCLASAFVSVIGYNINSFG